MAVGFRILPRGRQVDADAVARFGELTTEDVSLLLARAKCEDVTSTLEPDGWEGLVLGCDSVLELDGETLGKPGDAGVILPLLIAYGIATAVQIPQLRFQGIVALGGIFITGQLLLQTLLQFALMKPTILTYPQVEVHVSQCAQ